MKTEKLIPYVKNTAPKLHKADIDRLPLPKRLRTTIQNSGLKLKQLSKLSQADMEHIEGIGKKSVADICTMFCEVFGITIRKAPIPVKPAAELTPAKPVKPKKVRPKTEKEKKIEKRKNNIALAAMRKTGLVWSSKHGVVSVFDTVLMAEMAPHAYHKHGVENMPWYWHFYLIVSDTGPTGRTEITYEALNLHERPLLRSEIVEHFNIKHKSMLDEIGEGRTRAAAWVATPFLRDFTDNELLWLTGL